jgi:hypothetical protein
VTEFKILRTQNAEKGQREGGWEGEEMGEE